MTYKKMYMYMYMCVYRILNIRTKQLRTKTSHCLPPSQLGSFYPFFRAHAHVDTRRREPWLFEPHQLAAMRDAVRTRYELLPFWYTLFYESSKTGLPVAR